MAKVKDNQNENGTVTVEEAARVVAQAEEAKRQAFIDAYVALCNEHGYRIGTTPIQLQVIPNQ